MSCYKRSSFIIFTNICVRHFTNENTIMKIIQLNENTTENTQTLRFAREEKLILKATALIYIRALAQSGLQELNPRMGDSQSTSDTGLLGALTTENNDAISSAVTIVNSKSLTSQEVGGASDGIDHERSIKMFLATPIIQTTGNFSAVDGPTTFPNIAVGDSLFNNTILYDKIKGFHTIRYDTVVTVEFNANRFQTGRYILAFVPTGGPNSAISFIKAHRFNLTSITQLPHVEFDLNCDTKAQLRIPFISCQNSVKISSGVIPYGTPGVFFLYPYYPLGSTAGSSIASYTMWTHYENVTLYNAAIPQSGMRSQRKSKDLINLEVNKMGPVSKTLTMITDVSSALSVVPLLSSIAAPVSWVTDAMAKAAVTFGWSKPILLQQPMRTVREIVPFMSVADSHSVAVPLSLCANNHVSVAPGFAGTDSDELAIDFLKSIPSHWKTIQWLESQASSTTLLSDFTCPSTFLNNVTDGVTTVESWTPVAFLSKIYTLWRGGFRITFKVVKTEFHSGRLLFAWTAASREAGTFPSISTTTSPYVHKTIIDIREGNEFTVEIPFAATTNFLATTGVDDSISGRFYLMVLDPLRAPATVSSTVNILIEIAGAPDLTFAAPGMRNGEAFCPYIPVTQQSGLDRGDICSVLSVAIGESTPNKTNPLLYCELSTGEACVSLRQLLKRGGFILTSPEPSTFYSQIYPFVTMYMFGTAGAPTGTPLLDPYNLLSSLYCLSRGSMRIAGFTSNGSVTSIRYNSLQRLNIAVTSISTMLGSTGVTAAQWFYDSILSGTHVSLQTLGGWIMQVPQYTDGHSRAIASNYYYTGSSVTGHDHGTDRSYISSRSITTTYYADYIYRSVGDDFNMGGFVSIPPMWEISRP